MSAVVPDARLTGWLLAGAAAVALLSGAAALALAADRSPPVLTLDLGLLPPSSPAVTAVSAPAPKVAETAPPLPEDPAPPEAAPEVPKMAAAPEDAVAAALSLPDPEVPAVAEMRIPEKIVTPKPRPKRAEARRVADAKVKTADKPKTQREKPKPKKAADTLAGDAAASPPASSGKTKGSGGMSPAAYAKAVMKKIRSTRKAAGGGKGKAVVGFSIASDGSLATVMLLQGSGDATLDKVALDHIRRAAPFPAPPADAGRNFSFEFVGK